MLTAAGIAEALRTSRTEFARLYLQAQTSIPAHERQEFEAVGRDANDRVAFLRAILTAQTEGWLDNLLDVVVAAGMEDGRITEHLANRGGPILQAMVNAVRHYQHPHVVWRGIADAMRWTARVSVGNTTGTGVLVGPNLVLTAWHVVHSLFEPDVDDTGRISYKPKRGASDQLRFHFDDFLARVKRGKNLRPLRTITVEADENWYVAHSECHQAELAERMPEDIGELQGLWDYCLIRVKSAPGLERRWVPLSARAVVPPAKNQIVLFQHPAGQPMRIDSAEIAEPDVYNSSPHIPAVRFIHLANSAGGSSGGPCFDHSFSLFGLHQGSWKPSAAGGVHRANRGVPVVSILEHIADKFGGLPVPSADAVPVWKLGASQEHAPIIGQERFQTLVWRSALRGDPRIILIEGDDNSGKSFLVKVLGAMLSDKQHLKIVLSAEAVGKQNALELADTICAAAASPARDGVLQPGIRDVAETDTTASAWRRDEVVRRMVETLDDTRDGRMVWLAFVDLNKFEVQGIDARELLLLLYEQTRVVDWLRFVLDGFSGDLPRDLDAASERYSTTQGQVLQWSLPVSATDVKMYLARLNAEAELSLDDPTMAALSRYLHGRYSAACQTNRTNALRLLAEEVMEIGAAFLIAADEADAKGGGG